MHFFKERRSLLARFCISWLIIVSVYALVLSTYYVPYCQVRISMEYEMKQTIIRRVNFSSNSTLRTRVLAGSLPEVAAQPDPIPIPTGSVIILSYQRSGSSVFGHLFNSNPDVFYMYEPLDALYSYMYGTERGWNVPSDIRNFKDGSKRNISEQELTKVSEFLSQLMNCQTKHLPAELLDHPFYGYLLREHMSIFQFLRCTKSKRLNMEACSKSRRQVELQCGYRLGMQTEQTISDCNRLLTGDVTSAASVNISGRDIFREYTQCRDDFKRNCDSLCTPLLQNACASKPVKVLKLVRTTMRSMETLLKSHPELRIIHLMRDPRGVTLSRSTFESVRGIYSGNDSSTMRKEAGLYCRDVVDDIRTRLELEKLFPGKFYPLVYDDFVTDPHSYTADIYKFLDLPLRPSVSEAVRRIIRPYRYLKVTPTSIAEKWKNKINLFQNREIVNACREFFPLINRTWPLIEDV